MLNSFKQRFQENLNPSLQSIKYCQNTGRASVEMQFSDSADITIDLRFIGGEIIKNEDGTDKDILPLFNPDADIVDNANRLLRLDDYSLIMCLDNILNQESIKRIVAVYEQTDKGTN